MGYWHDETLSNYSCQPPELQLPSWRERMLRLFSPVGLFIMSGTFSDPRFNPTPDIPVVQAGCPFDAQYEGGRRHYGKAAFTAGVAYAMNRTDWDLFVAMDVDALFGNINLDALLKEFTTRPETMLAPGWLGYPGGPMQCWKREGASRLMHYRQTANLRDNDEAIQLIWEKELLHIFRGRWWNPWPTLWTCMNDGTSGRLSWPMISKPPVDVAVEYARTQSIHTKPVLP